MPSFASIPFAWPNFQVLSNDVVAAAPTAHGASVSVSHGRLLCDWDVAMAFAGQFAGGIVFPETLATPLLKSSLTIALANMPFFAGRACFTEDGRFDVTLNNAGARFVAASTSAKLADVLAALYERPYGRTLSNPWGAFWAPGDPVQLVEQQWPLAGGFVLHLSGGGSVLWVAAHHCLADFESLQTLAAHWAQAYNAQLRATARPAPPLVPIAAAEPAAPVPVESVAAEPVAAEPAAAVGGSAAEWPALGEEDYRRAVPEGRRFPRMSAEELDALSESEQQDEQGATPAAGEVVPPPAGEVACPSGEAVPPRREVVAATWWRGLLMRAYLRYHLMWRGGGVETRVCRVSSKRLAELKARAKRDLQSESAEAETPPSAPAKDGGDTAASSSAAAAAPPPLPVSARPRVEWVSTNDALVGRLLQLLHALPARRRHTVSVFMAADVRRRLSPPLPPCHVGNLLYSARLAGLRPAETPLGHLAALVRRELNCHLVPQFRGCLARTSRLVGRMGPRGGGSAGLLFAFCLERDPVENIFAPEGPVNMTRWDVDYGLWQFGPSRPLAFLPAHGPGVLVIHNDVPSAVPSSSSPSSASSASASAPSSSSSSPGGGDPPGDPPGVVLTVSMARVCWRQMDDTGIDLGSAI